MAEIDGETKFSQKELMSVLTCFCMLTLLKETFARCHDPNSLQMSAVSGDQKSCEVYGIKNYLSTVYGNATDIYCFGRDTRNLSIDLNGEKQAAEAVNVTTLKLTAILDVDSYKYRCKDEETNCTMFLTVRVKPAMTVVSPNIGRKLLYRKLYFVVPMNEDYELICSGNSVDNLIIRQNEREVIETEKLNDTTIISKKLNETKNIFYDYYCYYKQPKLHSKFDEPISNVVRVYIDYPPEASNFWCIEYNEQINCTWNVLSKYTTFRLFYVDTVGDSVIVCEDHSSKNTRLCEWQLDDIWTHGVEVYRDFMSTLVLEACNRVIYCKNQTFDFRHKWIMKPAAPVDIKIQQFESRWEVIRLEMFMPKNVFGYTPRIYKVKYTIPGTGPWEKTARLGSDFGSRFNGPDQSMYIHIITFRVPCPSSYFDASIIFKYYDTPDNESYWSDPYHFTFTTKPKNSGSNKLDPVCSTDTELIDNGIIAAYEVRKLGRYYQKKEVALRKEIDSLKQKRDRLRAARSKV